MLTNDEDIHRYIGISQHAMRWLWETYYESKETGEVVWTPLDAGQPHLLEPASGGISTVFTKFYVDHKQPMAARNQRIPTPSVLIFFVWPIDMSVAVTGTYVCITVESDRYTSEARTVMQWQHWQVTRDIWKMQAKYTYGVNRAEWIDPGTSDESDQLLPPPRRASTRCRAAPAATLESFVVLSSSLHIRIKKMFKSPRFIGSMSFFHTYICRPPKINRCCWGGTPDCSSTFSFMREIWKRRENG